MNALPPRRIIAGWHSCHNQVEDPDPYIDAIVTHGTLAYVYVKSGTQRPDDSWEVEVNLSQYSDPFTNDVRWAIEFWNDQAKLVEDFADRKNACDEFMLIRIQHGINKRIVLSHHGK